MKTLFFSLFVMAFFCCLFAGCKKESGENSTTVKGHVQNQLTGESLSGIPILIFECEHFIDNPTSCGVYKTLYTDANGNYSCTFSTAKHRIYELNIGRNDVILSKEYSKPITINSTNTIDFSEKPFKNLKVHLTVHRHDRSFLIIEIDDHDYEDFFYSSLYYGPNPAVDLDTVFITKIVAQRTFQLDAGLYNPAPAGGFADPVNTDVFFSTTSADTTYLSLNVP